MLLPRQAQDTGHKQQNRQLSELSTKCPGNDLFVCWFVWLVLAGGSDRVDRTQAAEKEREKATAGGGALCLSR
eukprot:COSAG06_NODE_35783_length_455_cov_2.014045_2_plen_72_part_01